MVQGRFSRLRWEGIDEINESNRSKSLVGPAAAPAADKAHDLSSYAGHPLFELLRRTKVPRHPDPSASPHQEAEFLLQAASEVEHQFIVQYLYALFSLDRDAGGELIGQSARHLGDIAEEEMGHLLTVQNTLLLIGLPPYLERERDPPAEPLPFPLTLEPASLPFVARFLVAESPAGAELPDDLGDLKKEIEHVGALYMMIYWLFQDGDAPQEPWLLPPVAFPAGQHLRPEDYNADGERVADLLNHAADWRATGGIHVLPPPSTALGTPAEMADAARRALFDVALQGEGPVDAGENPPKETSHFHRLLAIYQRLKELPGARLALEVPVNPHTVRTSEADPEEEPGLITDRGASLHARLFNIRYAMLLAEIALSVLTPRSKRVDNVPVRRTLALRAIRVEMRQAVGALSLKLVASPLKASQGGVVPPHAGAPFGLTPNLIPKAEREGWERLLQLIDESRELIDGAGDALSPEMENLREVDVAFREFVVARLAEF